MINFLFGFFLGAIAMYLAIEQPVLVDTANKEARCQVGSKTACTVTVINETKR